MFLFGIKFVFASYIGMRLYEEFHSKKAQSKGKKTIPQDNLQEDKTIVKYSQREKQLHYIAASNVSLGLSWLSYLNPIFLPAMLLVFTYSALPYLRVVEQSLLKKKKVDGYVLYGIADFMTLGLGRIATASFAVGLLHTARFVISNAEENTKQSIVNIFAKQPNYVWLLKEGIELKTPLEEVIKGDIAVVNTGDIIPVDGTIVKGFAAIDQQALTGESQPAEKAEGEIVFASTQVMTGSIHIQVRDSGNDTTVAKITNILNNSIDFKTNFQLRGEQWADSWNLPVLGLAFASMPFLCPVGTVVILNGHIANTIRVVAPLSTLNYINIASHKGILIKDGRVLEDLPNIDTFLFDKTGTLTSEVPEVGRILIYGESYSENEVLAYAAAAEGRLTHPIARAILNRAKAAELVLPEVDEADYTIGYGVCVLIDNKLIQVGSRRFMQKENIALPENFDEEMQDSHNAGHSLIMVAINDLFVGALELHAALRPEIGELLASLHSMGVKHFAIVSGDHRQPTQKLAETLGMDDYFYDVLPQNKAEIVEKLQAEGRSVCFVGDGVNDTIAMKKANISISLSGANSVATDTAQIVLMDASLKHLPKLMHLSVELNENLYKSWLFNIIPGVSTVICAFAFRIDILAGLLISQSGLILGTINAMMPLRQISKTEKLQVKNNNKQ